MKRFLVIFMAIIIFLNSISLANVEEQFKNVLLEATKEEITEENENKETEKEITEENENKETEKEITEENENKETEKEVTKESTILLQNYIEEETINVVIRIEGSDDTLVEETEIEVSNSNLSIYDYEEFGITNTEVLDDVTALHALVEGIKHWLITDGGMDEADETTVASMLYVNNGYLSMLMGIEEEYDEDYSGGNSWMYLHNDAMALNGIAEEKLEDGDELVFYYGYWSYRDDEYLTTKSSYFREKYLTKEEGESFYITLLTKDNEKEAVISDAVILLKNGDEIEFINNNDGSYTLCFKEVGEYELTAQTDDKYNIVRPYCKIIITEKEQKREYSSEWGSRRGEKNGITNGKTPRSAIEANEDWKTKVTSSWLYTSPIIAEGYIYTAAGKVLYKIDKENGMIIDEVTLTNSINGVESLTYGDGLIFIPEANGVVEAYDADTLNLLWTSPKATVGTQSLVSILYENGYLYTGTYGKTGGMYYCIDINNADKFAWEFIDEGVSYYWANPVIAGNAIIFGSDGGNLYSLNKSNGKLLDTYSADGNIRSGILYDEESNYLYFTTQKGLIYKVLLKRNGTFNCAKSIYNTISEYATASTSTPVLYNNRLYVGAKGTTNVISVVDAKNLESIYTVPMSGYPQCSMLLSDGYSELTNKVYLYSTYNSKPGGITVFEDFSGNTEPIVSELYIPEQEQYCICSVIADEEGSLYYKNDSGYLFKISLKPLELSAVTIATVPYDCDVILKDSEENVVEPIVNGSYELPEGNYTYNVSKNGYKSKSGEFFVTENDVENKEVKIINISLGKNSSNISQKEEINVSFKLLGDEKHGNGKEHTYRKNISDLPVWVSKTNVKVEKGMSVFELLDKMAETYDFEYDETQYDYISGIKLKNGMWMYEMDNGDKSGWMYRVNGKIVFSGAREYILKKGDNVVWYYTDNYEEEDNTIHFEGSAAKNYEEEKMEIPVVESAVISFNDKVDNINSLVLVRIGKDGNREIMFNAIYDEKVGGFNIINNDNFKFEIEIRNIDDSTFVNHWSCENMLFCLARGIIVDFDINPEKGVKMKDIREVQKIFGVDETLTEELQEDNYLTREKNDFRNSKMYW